MSVRGESVEEDEEEAAGAEEAEPETLQSIQQEAIREEESVLYGSVHGPVPLPQQPMTSIEEGTSGRERENRD